MDTYTDYLNEIEERKAQGLNPKPIDNGVLLAEIIEQIKDSANESCRLTEFLYLQYLARHDGAASVKAAFLKEIILGESVVEEITVPFAFELLSHMKGDLQLRSCWTSRWARMLRLLKRLLQP